jgi:glucose/arabinose dehydrogenase
MTRLALMLAAAFVSLPAWASETDNLIVPPGFHASLVAGALGPARHLAIRENGDIYVSTRTDRGPAVGIVALKLDNHKVVETEHFSEINGGTGIRFYKGALYADSPTTVYRFEFRGQELVPSAAPEILIDGMPSAGFPSRGLAFDDKDNLYLTVGASSNTCLAPNDVPPIGMKPCPSLEGRSGVWRFGAEKLGQKFPTDGEQIATGLRDMMAVDWSSEFEGLYGIMQGRNDRVDTVSEELHRIDKGANLGWPYTYYDTALHARVLAPEYGGDGKMLVEGSYDAPLAALPAHQSPLDFVFYTGRQFPESYRNGAFIAFHGGSGAALVEGHRGYDVMFLPFDHAGKPGVPQKFADGFAGPNPEDRNVGKAAYRPTGVAVAPDGSLYVVEGEKGRLWRISYEGK